MWNKTAFTEMLALGAPIVQAPMAGGATTVELVVAVSNTGGLGSLGAGYMSPTQIRNAIRGIKALTVAPFAVNLFIPGPYKATDNQLQEACNSINECATELNVMVKPMLGPYLESFDEQVAILLEEKIPVFSFTFGVLSDDLIARFKMNETFLIGTATTLEEAKILQQSGVDAIVAQGGEAGGHRGTFLDTSEDAMLPLDKLLSQLKDCVNIPIIAAGGIMNGKHIVESLNRGASAVQLGTAFLTCDEAGIHPSYKQALLEQTRDNTVLTNVFSGRLARGIRNKFIDCMCRKPETVLDYPIQNKLTGKIRAIAKENNNTEYMSMWAGKSCCLTRKLDAETLVSTLIREADSQLR